MCYKHGVRMEHGLAYEYIVSTSNVLLILSIVKGGLKNLITPYIDGRREYESIICPIKFFRLLYNACNLLIPTF